jgi:geranylgeranyl reductase family protein
MYGRTATWQVRGSALVISSPRPIFGFVDTFDLIIVGGGPAGATAALYAQRQGLSTALVDKEHFPRDKICGDALSGKTVAILHELGLLEEVAALPGAAITRIIFGSPDATAADIDLTRFDMTNGLTGHTLKQEGYVIRREIFDNFLFEKARAAADRTIEGFAVRDLVREDEQVVGVRGRYDGGDMEIRAPLVFGCDGFNSIVARKGGLYSHESKHWMVALRQYFTGVKGLTDQIELHFIDEVLPGYFWVFPIEEDRANVGIGMGHNDIKANGIHLKDALKAAIASPTFRTRFADAKPLEEPVGWNLPVGSRRRPAHGPGLLLLGDAASLIDPFTGEGIGNALYSARFAVDTAVAARSAGDFSAGFLRRSYEDKLWDSLGSELKISTRLHGLGRWPALMNVVIRKAANNLEVSDLLCGMMANAVPRKILVNPLFYLKLFFR